MFSLENPGMLIIIINHRIKYKYLTSCGRHSSGAENPGIKCKTYLDQLFNLISLNYLQKYIFAVGCHQPWTRISSMISRRCFLENRSASFSLRELFSLMSINQEKRKLYKHYKQTVSFNLNKISSRFASKPAWSCSWT